MNEFFSAPIPECRPYMSLVSRDWFGVCLVYDPRVCAMTFMSEGLLPIT